MTLSTNIGTFVASIRYLLHMSSFFWANLGKFACGSISELKVKEKKYADNFVMNLLIGTGLA